MYIKSETEQVREQIDNFCEDLEETTHNILWGLGYKESPLVVNEMLSRVKSLNHPENARISDIKALGWRLDELKDIVETLEDLVKDWSDCEL